MAINALEYAKIFMTTLDKQLIAEATSGWMEPNAGRVIYHGGDEVKIPKISTSGLGDYDRDKGFAQGAVTLSYETMKMTQDKRHFQSETIVSEKLIFAAAVSKPLDIPMPVCLRSFFVHPQKIIYFSNSMFSD